MEGSEAGACLPVNYYKHYIGDFQRDTGHLSLTERGAYLALIHHYYATEKPIPNDHAALCRIAGAMTKDEKNAVRVAMGFFEAVDSGLMHSRIEVEIEKAGQRSDTNREIALAREAKRKAEREEHEAFTNRATKGETIGSTKTPPYQTPDTSITETNVSVVGAKALDCPHQEIIALYNRILPELEQVLPSRWAGTRAKHLQARWRESAKHQRLEFWERFFTALRELPFYLGENNREWRANLGWIVKRENFDKLVEKLTDNARRAQHERNRPTETAAAQL